MNLESTTNEYKREYTDDIKKTVVAFANTDGGEIKIGISDDGSVVGVRNVDMTMVQVTNVIRDSIKPDVTMHTRCESMVMEGENVVIVHVQRGTACPYYLSGKGIRPEGVYVRQGSSTVPATESIILKMIRETGGDSFEASRSLMQDLTFEEAERIFQEENIKFEAEQKRTLCLIGRDGAFSNLGLLLSDQCAHTIKAAVFEGSSKRIFQDRAEFSGSLFKQLEEVYRYLNQFNHTRAEISGLKRIDMRNYPPDAVREALLNTIIHREYAYSGSTLISIFDDRIEFVTLGGLPKGIAFNDLLLGVSVLRNPRLADVFYRLHLIEAYGTGLPKIMECYHIYPTQPVIEVSDNAFKMTLPNTNYHRQSEMLGENAADAYKDDEWKAVRYLETHQHIARKEAEQALGFSQAKTIRLLNSLVEKGAIKKEGQGRNTRYSTVSSSQR